MEREGRRLRGSQVILVLSLVIGGVLVALIWRLLDPTTAKLGDDTETIAAVDGTLVLVGAVAALLTAAFVLVRPGPAPVARTIAAIFGSVLGALVSWQVGDLLGTPHLRAVGSAFIWPLATAVFLFVGSLLPGTSRKLLRPGPVFPVLEHTDHTPPLAQPSAPVAQPSAPVGDSPGPASVQPWASPENP